MPEWATPILGWLLRLGEDLATLGVFVALATAAYSMWRRTLGRRRALTEALTALSPMMQTERFAAQLGTPAFRVADDDSEDLIWIHPDAFVRAVAKDGTVLLYSITTRTKRFAPTFMRGHVISPDGATLEVRLGRSTFGGLPGNPDHVFGGRGARRWGYSEVYYYGNPGGYQRYVYSLSDAGWIPPSSDDLVTAVFRCASLDAERAPSQTDALEGVDDDVISHRHKAAFNTFTMVAPSWGVDDLQTLGITPGADVDLLRLARMTKGATRRKVRPRRS